jgi:hypothetical protein
MKFELSRQIKKKPSNIKFHENPSRWIRDIPCGHTDGQMDGWMDRHEGADSRFLKFCEHA